MKIFSLPEFIVKFLAIIAVFFAPIQDAAIAISILIVLDCITGIWASNKKGETFSSHKFFSSISKLIVYLALIMMAHLIQLHLIPEIPVLKFSIWFITLTEFSSFLENISIISGRDVIGYFKELLTSFKPKK